MFVLDISVAIPFKNKSLRVAASSVLNHVCSRIVPIGHKYSSGHPAALTVSLTRCVSLSDSRVILTDVCTYATTVL